MLFCFSNVLQMMLKFENCMFFVLCMGAKQTEKDKNKNFMFSW